MVSALSDVLWYLLSRYGGGDIKKRFCQIVGV